MMCIFLIVIFVVGLGVILYFDHKGVKNNKKKTLYGAYLLLGGFIARFWLGTKIAEQDLLTPRGIETKAQIEYIQKGLFSAIDKNIIQILTWNQLEELVCGKNKLDITDFKAHTEYQGYNENDKIIKWFWKWLEGSKDEIQFKYLKFVQEELDCQNQDLVIVMFILLQK